MKVNITYNIELEQIPIEIADRVAKLHGPFNDIKVGLLDIEKSIRTEHMSEVFEAIDQWRQDLAELDNYMADYGTILAEYQKAKAELFIAKQTPPENPQQEPHSNKQLESDIAESQQQTEDMDLILKGLDERERQ